MSPDTELAKYSLQNYIYWVHGFERYFAGMEKKEEKNVRFYDLKPIAVIEPVQRIVSYLLLDEFGLIMAADETASSLFHCTEEAFVGHNIIKWVPNIIWPSSSDDLDQVCC